MDAWLRELIESVQRGLRALIDAVWERITWVYNLFVQIFLGIRDAWSDVLNRARYHRDRLISFVAETYATSYWIVTIRIPQWVRAEVGGAVNWLVIQVNAARTFAQGVVNNTIRWVTDRLNEARAFVDKLAYLTGQKVGELVNAINRINALVFTLLTSPARMSTWLIEALIRELWSYVDRNGDRIVRWVRERSIAYTLLFANRIEDMLRRLM